MARTKKAVPETPTEETTVEETVIVPETPTEETVYLIRVMDKDGTIKKIDPRNDLNWRKKYRHISGESFHF